MQLNKYGKDNHRFALNHTICFEQSLMFRIRAVNPGKDGIYGLYFTCETRTQRHVLELGWCGNHQFHSYAGRRDEYLINSENNPDIGVLHEFPPTIQETEES